MASKRRKRKKGSNKRWVPPTNYTPWVWALFAANVCVGLLFSRISSLTVLRVSGAPSFDQERLVKAAQSVADTPRFLAKPNLVRSLVMENSAVESVQYRANVFGRGVLTITYKSPVAVFDSGAGLMLSSQGSVFSAPVVPKGLPLLTPPHAEGGRNLSIVGAWRTREAAVLCKSIASELSNERWRVEASKTGFVTLYPASGGVVELGSLDDSVAKVKALARILRGDPGLLSKISKLRLYSPEKPVYEPK